MEAQLCFDSGLKLICVVGSGVSYLLIDNTTQIIYGFQVRAVGWSVKHSNTMVSTPVTSSFGLPKAAGKRKSASIKLANLQKNKVISIKSSW